MTAAVQEFIRQVRTTPAGMPRRVVVATPPAPKSTFMADLYREILDPGTPWLAVAPKELTDVSAAAKAVGSEMLVHVHWTSWALGTLDRKPAEEALQRALDILDGMQDHRMIWTVHNTLPHECRHEDLEGVLRQRLADQADVIHVMNPNTREVVAPWYDLPETKIVQADHPWPRVQRIDRNEACRMLGLDPRYRWIGFLGQIRAYKRVDSLLAALDLLPADHRCLIAGAPDESERMRSLLAGTRRHPKIALLEGHVTDSVLHAAGSAMDVVVIPYSGTLNSGVVPLAVALGRVTAVPSPTAPYCAAEAGDDHRQAHALASLISDASSRRPQGGPAPSVDALAESFWT